MLLWRGQERQGLRRLKGRDAMKLQRIKYFVTLAETLSFSRTAQIHYVSQTTISQQIKLLEQELGFDLFSRTRRSVELTPAGALYLPEARKALDVLDSAEEKARMFHRTQRLRLRLRLIRGVTPGYIAPVLGTFARANPDVDLECSYCPVARLYPGVIAGEADVGFTFDLDPAPRSGIAKVALESLGQYVVTSVHSKLAQHATLTRAQLKGERLLNGVESCKTPPAQVADGQEGRPWTDRTDELVEDMDSLMLAVSLNRGYTLMCGAVARMLPSSLALVAIPVEGERVPLVAIYRENDENPAIHRLISTVQSLL